MQLHKAIFDIFRKDWKLFLAANLIFYGPVAVGVIVAILRPEVQEAVIEFFRRALSTGTLSPVTEAASAGDVLRTSLLIFLYNFLVATILTSTLPSVVFPPWTSLIFALRGLLVGIAVAAPGGGATAVDMASRYIVLLLEGEAYVVAIFASLRQIEALVLPVRLGERSRLKAYARALLDTLALTGIVGAMLAFSALVEAALVIWLGV
jgi:hypothetical protein